LFSTTGGKTGTHCSGTKGSNPVPSSGESDRIRRSAANGDVDFTKLPEGELAAIVRGREAFALYGWKPYMHNPRLKRWLHRIDLPTLLLWGAEDRIVTPAYGEGWRQAIPGARLEIIPQAGHFPHWEQPEAFAERLWAFVGKND
jgi:pimeloyl-ACP methyl ester carboxylesterase